jgi:hypothetical protein
MDPYLVAAMSGLRAFRKAHPRLGILHLELLLHIARQSGADVTAYAGALDMPLLSTGLAIRDLAQADTKLLSFEIGRHGRVEQVTLASAGRDVIGAFVSDGR